MSHQVGLRNERPVICTDQTIIRNVSIQSYEVAMVVRFPSRCACIQYFLFFLRYLLPTRSVRGESNCDDQAPQAKQRKAEHIGSWMFL